MLWGTYRSGNYLGLRTRAPRSLSAGLMWFDPDAKSAAEQGAPSFGAAAPTLPPLRHEAQERAGATGSSAPRVLAAGPSARETTLEVRAGEERLRDLAVPRERQEKRKAWIKEMKRRQEAEEMKECSFKPAVISNAPTKGR